MLLLDLEEYEFVEAIDERLTMFVGLVVLIVTLTINCSEVSHTHKMS